jgi:hypothetical protein
MKNFNTRWLRIIIDVEEAMIYESRQDKMRDS